MWINRPLLGQPTWPTQPLMHSKSINELQIDVCDHNQWWLRLVNGYEVEAGMMLFAGKTM